MKSKARKPLFDRLKTGLEDAIRHAKGEITLKTTVVELADPPPDIRREDVTRLRLDNRLSQTAFARLLNVSTRTVQGWEQGIHMPSQAALRLIQVFRQDSEGLLRVAGITTNPAPVKVDGRKPKASRQEGASKAKAKSRVL